jgi:hypothetical protein
MANTYTLIASATASGGETTITFSSIPQTYTDLVMRASYRGDNAVAWAGNLSLRLNGVAGTNNISLVGTGSAAQSAVFSQWYAIIDSSGSYLSNSNGNTSNTFSNIEWYIPSYNVVQVKQVSGYAVGEQNSSTAYMMASANYYNTALAISSLAVRDLNGMGAGSTFFLYGISSS